MPDVGGQFPSARWRKAGSGPLWRRWPEVAAGADSHRRGGQARTVCGSLPQFRRPVGAGDRLVREGTRSVVSVGTRWDSTGSGVTGWHGCRVLGDQGSAVQIRPARPTRNPCDGRGFDVSGLSLAGSVRVGRFVGHLSAVPVRSRPVLTRVL